MGSAVLSVFLHWRSNPTLETPLRWRSVVRTVSWCSYLLEECSGAHELQSRLLRSEARLQERSRTRTLSQWALLSALLTELELAD